MAIDAPVLPHGLAMQSAGPRDRGSGQREAHRAAPMLGQRRDEDRRPPFFAPFAATDRDRSFAIRVSSKPSFSPRSPP